MNYHVKEVEHHMSDPFNRKDAVVPEVGDIIKITPLNGKELTVICVHDNNTMSGGYKGDTCQNYCCFGRSYVFMCMHLPIKCNDDIMFKNIDDVLEDL